MLGESFWGIDIGQSALKALRCTTGADKNHLTAEAFDYIEYPKILSQPDADPVELVREALQEFLKRNPTKGMKVAISVPGQRGLPRFVKLPPVESSKIPDLVKYEAKQQIPFPLEDVVWDFQQMPGGTEEDGFSMETEVGLFAMKRDEVFRALRPFTNAGVEVHIVQLTPIALFNYIVFDRIRKKLPPIEEFNPEDPPESSIVMSLGTDTSDLVVTNGYRMWQRSIPIGGNHFTKALTKELKITFSKAEHLKRNAMKAEDPRAIFQAMRPVFNELVTEVQRSLNYFNSSSRNAKLGKIYALGNAMKLRGLQKFLSQNLSMEIETVETFRQLSGSSVTNSPQFKENIASFGVSYGLCVQAMNQGILSTNLLPGEIIKERMIRAKKPWAVAAAAALMIGCGIGIVGNWQRWKTSVIDTTEYKNAFAKIQQTEETSKKFNEEFTASETNFKLVSGLGNDVAQLVERQMEWPVMMSAVSQLLPQAGIDPVKEMEKKLEERRQIHIASMDCEWTPDLQAWFKGWQTQYFRTNPEIAKKMNVAVAPATDPNAATPTPDPAATPAPSPDPNAAPAGDAAAPTDFGPKGPGFIIELRGYHYHNANGGIGQQGGYLYVVNNFLKKFDNATVKIKNIKGNTEEVKLKDIGVEFPILVDFSPKPFQTIVTNKYREASNVRTPNPMAPTAGGFGGLPSPMAPGGVPTPSPNEQLEATAINFTIQFAWTPRTETERKEIKAKLDREKVQAATNATASR